MPLTHTRELFAKALKGKYALGAFNVNNMEQIQNLLEEKNQIENEWNQRVKQLEQSLNEKDKKLLELIENNIRRLTNIFKVKN